MTAKDTSKRRHRGRPISEANPGEKATLGLRVSGAFKDHLHRIAWLNDRPLSQEAEFRLEQSFHKQSLLPDVLALAYGREMAGILMAIATAMVEAGREVTLDRPRRKGQHWTHHPHAFDQAVKAAAEMLEWFRPAGEPVPDDGGWAYQDGPTVAYRLKLLLKDEPCGYEIDFVGHSIGQLQEMLGNRLDRLPIPTSGMGDRGTARDKAAPHPGAPSPELGERFRADREAVEVQVRDYLRLVDQRRELEKQSQFIEAQLEALNEDLEVRIAVERDVAERLERDDFRLAHILRS